MRKSKTYILVGLAGLLLGLIVLFEHRLPGTVQQEKAGSRVLPNFDAGAVSRLALRLTNQTPFIVARTNGQWHFVAPFRYPAQADGIERLLAALEQMRVGSIITRSDVPVGPEELAQFGLAAPPVEIEAEARGRTIRLLVGGPTPLGDTLYLRTSERPEVVTGPKSIRQLIPAQADDWRRTELFRLAQLDFDRVEIRPATNGFEAVRSPINGVWRMTKPLLTRIDNAKLDYLFQELDLASVRRFVTADPNADLEPYGLQPPEREIAFANGSNEVAVFQIGRSPADNPDLIHLRLPRYASVVLVNRRTIEPWLAPFQDFCDRRLMAFRPADVDRIEIRADETFAVERQGPEGWRIVQPVERPADTLLVLETLAELASLEFLAFEREVATDFARYGLDPPQREYRLLTRSTNDVGTITNLPLAELDIGFPADIYYLARRNQENSVVRMLDNGRLPAASFQLRDPRIWDFATNQIVSIGIEQLGERRELVRTAPGEWVAGANPADPVRGFMVEEAAYRLGKLRADRWVAQGEEALNRYGFSVIDHRLRITLRDGDQQTERVIRFGRPSAGGGAYAAVTLDDDPTPVVFECPQSLYDFVRSDLSIFGNR